MNNERRKRLDAAISALEEAKQAIEEVQGGEQDAFDNLPESIQSGEQGSNMETAIEALTAAIDSIDEALSSTEEAKS